jgi:hypothetical protein
METRRQEGGSREPADQEAAISTRPEGPVRRATGGSGASAYPHYRDRHEVYILVTKDDLKETRILGWIQQTLFGIGTFFFSGAFWLLMELLSPSSISNLLRGLPCA